MSQKINSVGKLDLGPRLELFDKCVKSLEDEIAELETGKLDGTLDLVGSYAIKDEFRALLPFINGPLLTFQEAMLQTKYTENQRQQSQSIQSLLVNSSLQYDGSAGTGRSGSVQTQPIAIKTQAPSASVTGTPLVSMAAATHPSTFSQSIQLQSTSQYQQPIQLPSISQSNNSLPSVVGSTTTSRQITPLAPLTNVASSSQFLPKTGHTTTQWMNLSTLGGPPIGQANLSTERLPVLTSSDAGGGIMGSTQQPLPVNAGGGDNRSNGGVISSAVGQGSTSARSNSQASIMATSQNGTPGVVASTPASATVGADASSASAPVVASSKNQVEPTLAESAVQSSPRRPTRGKSKADEPSADSTPAASLTSPEPHPSTRSEMSTRRGTIAAPQASAIQPLPKSSPAAATRSGASSTTMTSPPTGSGTKRANEVVGKNSTADASDNVRRSKRISQ